MAKDRDEYHLPKFPPGVADTFKRLCEALPDDQIPELKLILDRNVQDIVANAKRHERIDLRRVCELADLSHFLLDRYSELNEEQRALVIGAVRYFTIGEDAVCDHAFASGFDDDAQVMNYVLDQLGIEGRFLDV